MTALARDVDHVLRTVFKRCVQCDTTVKLSCARIEPACKADEMCIQVLQSCDACPSVKCVPNSYDPTPTDGSKPKTNDDGPNVGAIAGGVIGGIAFVAIATFIVWKYCLKGRRRKIDPDWQPEEEYPPEKMESDFVSHRSTRASTHTVASMASSVLTRASNIIQIAYIPGVTNRSGPGSPDLLVPPVPPIPAMSPSSGMHSPYSASEQHFFLPDFRDSMASTADGRSSYARTSIAPSLLPRGSVASTVYRQNAIVSPLPAQTIVRGKAAVVSVKSSGSNSPAETPGLETPPVPQIDPRHNLEPIRIQMPSSSSEIGRQNSIRSTATLGPIRALNITKKKATPESTTPRSTSSGSTGSFSDKTVTPPTPAMRPVTDISITSSDDGVTHSRARRAGEEDSDSDSDDDNDEHSRAKRSLLRNSDTTDMSDTPTSIQSPFSDSSSIEPSRPDVGVRRNTSRCSALRPPMTPITEEASSKRASRASKRTQSPFSDDNRSDL